MNIGIFGGSFNPVHSGHMGIAGKAISELSLDKLYVVPAAMNPFKAQDGEKPGSFDAATRLLLLRAAFNGNAKVTVDDRELKKGGISYAVDTVEEIAAENPGAAITFIVGEDSVPGLPDWKDYSRLKELCAFKAYPRTKESSTEIRRRIMSGEDLGDLVPEQVGLFIKHRVTENPDAKLAGAVRAGLARKEGYCPCRLPKLPEFFCPCEEFRSQLADDAFHGLCHCRLYLKP